MDDDKMTIYHHLMRWRLICTFYVPCALFLLVLVFDDVIPIWILGGVVCLTLYVGIFAFMAKNFCPNCHQQFFGMGGSEDKKTNWHLLFGKKCQHCQYPYDDQ